MMQRIRYILRSEGLSGLASRGLAAVYRLGIRPMLPAARQVRYADVEVAHQWKRGDEAVPRRWRPAEIEDVPSYEAALIGGLNAHVQPGDRVVVVGGGAGVTATIAAQLAGPDGHVTCFEGGRQSAAAVRKTAEINGVSDRLTVEHAIVARSVAVFGDAPDRAFVSPSELPDCDVLELDCEGAEIDILPHLVIRPRVLLVETHGFRGAPTQAVRELMESLGYDVADQGIAEPRVRAFCEENDIRVLEGLRR